jgi:indoleamine 2,3-dioxygenase
LGDNLLEITASLPENELTAVLREFRQYRPNTQREYIKSVETRARLVKVKEFAYADVKSLALYVLNVDQVRMDCLSLVS